MYLPLIALFVAISGGMSVSYMAEDSLPGDPLYGVKVHVNDGMKHLVAVTDESEALVAAELISRRAQEARVLKTSGRLDTGAKLVLAEEIQDEVERWNKATSGLGGNVGGNTYIEAKEVFDSQSEDNADIFQLLGVTVTATTTSAQPEDSYATSSSSVFLEGSVSPADTDTDVDLSSVARDELEAGVGIDASSSTSLEARVIDMR